MATLFRYVPDQVCLLAVPPKCWRFRWVGAMTIRLTLMVLVVGGARTGRAKTGPD
ncbi:MAG: hypothetical protein IPL59_15935 [Candidatus Competibacteraceae bacterium]|nr:hypothetical protein [Candidatus Competibacteraceae bacterium]